MVDWRMEHDSLARFLTALQPQQKPKDLKVKECRKRLHSGLPAANFCQRSYRYPFEIKEGLQVGGAKDRNRA